MNVPIANRISATSTSASRGVDAPPLTRRRTPRDAPGASITRSVPENTLIDSQTNPNVAKKRDDEGLMYLALDAVTETGVIAVAMSVRAVSSSVPLQPVR